MEENTVFGKKKWGIFTHFLSHEQIPVTTGEAWNERVNSVDVDLWADQLAELGADFMGIPFMQAYRFMSAPNATYDKITGYKPGEACATRDFIMDLSDALKKRGIELMLYFTADGPFRDEKAQKALGGPKEPEITGFRSWNDCKVTEEFVDNWSAVLKEFSLRYGDRAFAWWIDGAYDGGACDLFVDYTAPYFDGTREKYLQKYKDAILAGNPNAKVAFNGGVRRPICRYAAVDDFTAGEEWKAFQLPDGPIKQGVPWFEFLCGYYWFNGETEDTGWITPEFMLDYTQKVIDRGGVVMYNVDFVKDKGMHPKEFEILSSLKNLKK